MKKTANHKLLFPLFTAVALLLLLLLIPLIGNANEKKESEDIIYQNVTAYKPALPQQLVKDANAKSQEFLKFFKTPTKQLMPLGFYAMRYDMKDVATLEKLRHRGIVLFHKYHSEQPIADALDDLRVAKEAGAAVLQNLPSKYLTTRGNDYWRQYISTLADNKQILVWYLPEETEWENLKYLEMIASLIRDIDKDNRPIITYSRNEPPSYLHRVGGIVDAVVFGYYPNYYDKGTRVGVKERMDKAYSSGVPTVIAALSAFKSNRGKRRWTNPEHVRFDAYLALVSGAKGILWYKYDDAKKYPPLLEAILETAEELNGTENIGEVLLSGEKPDWLKCKASFSRRDELGGRNPPLNYDSIFLWTAREYKDYLYIFVLNTSQESEIVGDGAAPYDVKLKFATFTTTAETSIIGENRKIKLVDGYLVDTLGPLEIKIYKRPLR